MTISHCLGMLLDGTDYDIDLDVAGTLLTENPVWCTLQLNQSRRLRVIIGKLESNMSHTFEILLEHCEVKKKFYFIGQPNFYH